MVDLLHALQGNDLVFLRMIANAWGIELQAADVYTALPLLAKTMLQDKLFQEIIEALPSEAHQALQKLYNQEGQIPWSAFTRQFGEVRVMGAGRRDRERPDLHPTSPSEVLWYRRVNWPGIFYQRIRAPGICFYPG